MLFVDNWLNRSFASFSLDVILKCAFHSRIRVSSPRIACSCSAFLHFQQHYCTEVSVVICYFYVFIRKSLCSEQQMIQFFFTRMPLNEMLIEHNTMLNGCREWQPQWHTKYVCIVCCPNFFTLDYMKILMRIKKHAVLYSYPSSVVCESVYLCVGQ